MTPVSKCVSTMFGKQNIFTIFQILWIIEINYLGLNAIMNFVNKRNIFNIILPNEIEKYNNIILNIFNKYSQFIFCLSIGLMLCGACFTFIKRINIIKDYKNVIMYIDFGWEIGIWLLFIYITYYIYYNLGIIRLFIPCVIFLFKTYVWEEFFDHSKKYYN